MSIGAIILVVIVIVLFQVCSGGVDIGGGAFDGFGQAPVDEAPLPPGSDPDAQLVEFMNFLTIDIQDSWKDTFREAGQPYRDAKVVLYEGSTQTGCGLGTEDVGPFYCPADQRIYLDLDFFRELRGRFEAPGDFAQAYVVSHEFGHHIQRLLGIERDVRAAQQADPSRQNELSVRLELQADCLAGVWAYTAEERGLLEAGDLEEGLAAAAAVGDDRIQKQATGQTDPHTWTHGSSEQRSRWFRAGFNRGEIAACDTFSGDI
jgi:predicted metalloprotease